MYVPKRLNKEYSPIPEYNTIPTIPQSNSSLYYPGTTIPDYTYVTGVAIRDIYNGDGGVKIYQYPYTKYGEYSEAVDYISYLLDDVWSRYSYEEDGDKLVWSYRKGMKLVQISFYTEYDEIWITFSTDN